MFTALHAPSQAINLNPITNSLYLPKARMPTKEDLDVTSLGVKAAFFKSMDLNRFHACYGINQPLNIGWAKKLLDDFVFMASAERSNQEQEQTSQVLFTAAACVLMQLMEHKASVTVTAADVIHKACDLARQRIYSYTTEQIAAGCTALNNLWADRGERGAIRIQPRNILQLKK